MVVKKSQSDVDDALRVTVGLPPRINADGKEVQSPTPLDKCAPVCLWFGDRAAVLSPEDARSLALSLLDAVSESLSQAVIAKFLTHGLMKDGREARAILAGFAAYRWNETMREMQTAEPINTDAPANTGVA